MAKAVLAIFFGLAGWGVALRLRLPAPALLGPMVAVGSWAVTGVAQASFPTWVKPLLQVVVGTFVGCRVDRASLARLRSFAGQALVVTAWMTASGLAIGFALAYLSGVDLATALLGATPGGLAEMSIMAMSVEADVATVTALQTLRLVATLSLFPLYANRVANNQGARLVHWSGEEQNGGARENRQGAAAQMQRSTRGIGDVGRWIATLAVGALGGWALGLVRIPAAGLMGSMVLVGAVRAAGANIGQPPQVIRSLAQVGVGVLVGASLTSETLVHLRGMILLVIVTTAATVGSGVVLGHLIHRWLGLDLSTAVLACAPAGVTQMAVVGDELGADVFVVTMFQLARLMTAVVILPLLFSMLLRWTEASTA